MTPLATRLAPRAKAICNSLGCPSGDESFVVDGDLGHLEHLIHEVSHAVLLKLEVTEDDALGTRISNAIVELPERLRIDQEADAWGVEWHVWQQLALPMTYREAVIHAEVQGVAEDHLDASVRFMTHGPEVKAVMSHLKRLDRSCHHGNMAPPR